jgi:hypothetical protein
MATPVLARQTTRMPRLEYQKTPLRIGADRHWTSAAQGLAAALLAAALLSSAPAVWDVMEYFRDVDPVEPHGIARWALLVLLLATVQIAYAFYLFQLPDWTSVRIVTLHALAMAAFYALALGGVLVSGAGSWVVGPDGWQLADQLAGGRAALWCVAMVSLSSVLAFFAGRLAMRWRRAESIVRQAGLSVGQASSLP